MSSAHSILVKLTGDRTPFYPKRELSIQGAFERLDREMITPWVFLEASGGICVRNCKGIEVRYAGIKFEGAPQQVFWHGFIQPCVVEIIVQQIDETIRDANEHPELGPAALQETSELLNILATKVFLRMAEIDQRLRGGGFPKSVRPKSVESNIEAMKVEIGRHTDAARQLLALRRPAETRRRFVRPWWPIAVAAFTGILAVTGFLADLQSLDVFVWLRSLIISLLR